MQPASLTHLPDVTITRSLCVLADFDSRCEQRYSFVCEKHNITSVEVEPLEPQPGGLPCGNGSISFRNKV